MSTTAMAESNGHHPPRGGIRLTSVAELRELAALFYQGGVSAVKGLDKPEKVAVLILAGLDLGLSPTQAVAGLMLVNGRPAPYGDTALALVRASGLLEAIAETVSGDGDDRGGTCVVKRKGEPERSFRFSIADAKRARLWGKAGPWTEYPDRMLQMRPRGFALRDVFPDVLRGLAIAEEVMDIPAVAVAVEVPASPAGPPPAPPALPEAAASEDQLRRLAGLRDSLFASKFAAGGSDAEKKQLWAGTLAPYRVESAKQLTPAQADELIAALEREHDFPTSRPASSA